MIKKGGGGWNYPALSDGIKSALYNKGKGEMLAHTFVKVHGAPNLTEDRRSGRETIKAKNREIWIFYVL